MILPAFLACALLSPTCLPQSPAQIAAFKASFAKRRSDTPTAKPDPAIQRCMAILAAETKRRLVAQTADEFAIGGLLLPFLKAVGEKSYPASSYYIADLNLADRGDQKAISVTMGAVSRLSYWRSGKPISLPNRFSWLYGYEAHPYFADCGALVIHATSVQDAGMRFRTKAIVVSTTGATPKIVAEIPGEWLLEEEEEPSPFVIDGDTLTFMSLDAPKTFQISSSTKLFVRKSTYAISQKGLRRTSLKLEMPAAREVDRWIWTTLRTRRPDPLQSRFVQANGTEWPHVFSVSERPVKDGVEVRIVGDVTYRFHLTKRSGKLAVDGFQRQLP